MLTELDTFTLERMTILIGQSLQVFEGIRLAVFVLQMGPITTLFGEFADELRDDPVFFGVVNGWP